MHWSKINRRKYVADKAKKMNEEKLRNPIVESVSRQTKNPILRYFRRTRHLICHFLISVLRRQRQTNKPAKFPAYCGLMSHSQNHKHHLFYLFLLFSQEFFICVQWQSVKIESWQVLEMRSYLMRTVTSVFFFWREIRQKQNTKSNEMNDKEKYDANNMAKWNFYKLHFMHSVELSHFLLSQVKDLYDIS